MINKSPGPRLAFLPDTDAEKLAETMVAMANSDGGLIIFGLDEKGRPIQQIWEEEADGALREAAVLCKPPVPSSWQMVETKAGSLIGVNVAR
ncbi:MAG: ATP-binding protein, partial [Candidatus Promineifilaceae bacterium]